MEKESSGTGFDFDSYRLFVSQLKEKDNSEIEKIISRYALYKPEMIEAALYTAVEKGLISFELKEKLLAQIKLNLSDVHDYRKKKAWEAVNAFSEYASRYTDDEIYEIIENPADRIIDVYHGVLLAARERELISDEDFSSSFDAALKALRSEEEIEREETDTFLRDMFQEEADISDEKAEAERERYWKCPSCGENVDMNFDVCWNCNAAMPENPEHPDKEEMKKELSYRLPAKTAKIGLTLLVAGVLVMALSYLRVHFHPGFFWRHRYVDIYIGGIAAAAGVIILICHFLGKKDN